MYGFGDASKYWYLRVKEELINLGGNTSSTDPGIFYWKENNELIDISICHVDNIVYRGTTKFENSVNQKFKQIFKTKLFRNKYSNLAVKIQKYLHI